jgi:hypothetical protein
LGRQYPNTSVSGLPWSLKKRIIYWVESYCKCTIYYVPCNNWPQYIHLNTNIVVDFSLFKLIQWHLPNPKKMSLLKLEQKRLRHSLRCQLSYVFNTLSDNTQSQPGMNTWSTPTTSKRELQRQFVKTSVNSGRANLQCVSQSQASLHHHTEVLSCLQNWESNVLPPCCTHAGTPF